MKCPNCGYAKVTYDISHSKRNQKDRLAGKKGEPRIDFHATCKKCGWKGTIEQGDVN